MKRLITIFATMLGVACGTATQNSLTIEEIDAELTTMLMQERETSFYMDDNGYVEKLSLQRDFAEHLEYHLNNPLTFEAEMPQLAKMVKIRTTPNGKCKFYSYKVYCCGSVGSSINFIQYKDDSGTVRCIPYLNNLLSSRNICDVWEFECFGVEYYAIKSCRYYAVDYWTFALEIITIHDGVVYPVGNFFPEDADVITRESYNLYDEDGEYIESISSSALYMDVCNTVYADSEVNFDFDPETLTLTIADEVEDEYGRFVIENSVYQLLNPEVY